MYGYGTGGFRGPVSGRQVLASETAKRSSKEKRVYVGNLAFPVKWNDLKDFMKADGKFNVIFAEVMTGADGRSKGCGVVEFATPEDAQQAIQELNDKELMGRPVFIREDREEQARFGGPPRGGFTPGFAGRGGFGGAAGYGGPAARFGLGAGASGQGAGIRVEGLNDKVSWQDLKDLFRQDGLRNVIRAEIYQGSGAPGATDNWGTVTFASALEVKQAIDTFNNLEINGMVLRVTADPNAPGSNGSPFAGATGAFAQGGIGANGIGEPSSQIYIKNLPWSTTNEDLVELFKTVGTVQKAEILLMGDRSKGTGIVEFASVSDAEAAINGFQNYVYGGRPLGLKFNREKHEFGPSAAAAA